MAESNTKQLTARLKGLNDATQKLQAELSKLKKGTREYLTVEKQLLETSKEQLRVRKELQKTSGFIADGNKKAAATKKAANREISRANKLEQKQNNILKKGNSGFLARVKTLGLYLGASAAIAATLKALQFIFIGSAKEAIEFEKNIANLGAVAGVSGKELEALAENALSVAGTTKFTAQEIVGLQTELAKLGFSADEIIASTAAMADVAAALGAPLGEVAAAVGKTINQFGLLVEEARFAGDVIVSAINNSALSFEGFGTAIQYVGPLASELGLDLQQTAAAMGVLADNGFKASRIGTGLRGILTEISKTSADAEGELKKLANQNISLSQAVDLVGKRNAAQLITILDNIEALDDAEGKYYEQGRAAQAAAQQMDTFDGQMKILNSAVKEVQIGFGQWVVDSGLVVAALGLISASAQRTVLGLKELRNLSIDEIDAGVSDVLDGKISSRDLAVQKYADAHNMTIEEVEKQMAKHREKAEVIYVNGVRTIQAPRLMEEYQAVVGLTEQIDKLVDSKREQFEIDKGRGQIDDEFNDRLNRLIHLRSEGNIVNSQANKLYDDLKDKKAALNKLLEDETDLSEGEIIRIKASISEIELKQRQTRNLIASTEELAGIERKTYEDELKRIKRLRNERLKELEEQYAAEVLLAETQEEKRDIELRFAKLRSEANKEYIGQLNELKDGLVFKQNIKQLEDLVYQWEQLADISGEVVGQVDDAIGNFNKDVQAYIKEQQTLFDSGEIDLDTRNTRIRQYIQEQKANFKTFIQELIKVGDVSAEIGENLLQAVDNIDEGGNDLLAAKGGVFGLLFGLSPEEFAAKSQEEADALFADALSKAMLKAAKKGLQEVNDIYGDFAEVRLENFKNQQQQELDVIKARYEIEADILKSQLDNQLITESQFRQKQLELRKAQIAEENAINKQIFEAEKQADRQAAIVDGLEAVAIAGVDAVLASKGDPVTAAIRAAISAALIGASTTARVAAINQRQFFPQKFEEGGMVYGPSHSEGGVPFTVQGQGGYEMEGGEFIVNKRSAALHKDLLERINSSSRTQAVVGTNKFANGGQVVGSSVDDSVNYLRAIAEATTTSAVNSGKPVRAFVSDKDLNNNARERQLRERNNRV